MQRLPSDSHASPVGDTDLKSELDRGAGHDMVLKSEPTGAHTGTHPATESKPNPLTGDLDKQRALTIKSLLLTHPL